MEKTLSVSAIVGVLALGTIIAVKPDTTKIVSANTSEANVLATDMITSGPTLDKVRCCKKYSEDRAANKLVVRWLCDRGTGDFAPPSTWIAKLDKQVQAEPTAQCFEVDPKDLGNTIEVSRTIVTGLAPTPPPMLDDLMRQPEPKPVEGAPGETKEIEKP